MVLADTNIFIDFLRKRNSAPDLVASLAEGTVLLHPFVEGELYLSGIASEVKELLRYLPRALLVEHTLVLRFIERYAEKIRGVGYVDIHLLLSATQMHARLLTGDQALRALAENY